MTDSSRRFPVPDLIEGLVTTVSVLLADYGPDPLHGSLAERQMEATLWASDVRNAFSQASLLIEILSDHILSFKRSVTEPVLPTAAWASARGVLETSALSAWLLAPNIDPRERAARSYALRYDGLVEQKKFAQSIHDNAILSQATKRIEQVTRKAVAQGHNRLTDKDGRQYGLGTRLPPATDLVASQLDAEPEYRLFSAMLHGHHWATQKLSFSSAGGREEVLLEKSMSSMAILYLARRITLYFAAPLRRKFDLYGWQRSVLDTNLDLVLSALQHLVDALNEQTPPGLA